MTCRYLIIIILSGQKITGSQAQICRGIHQIIELLMGNFDLRDNVEWKSRLIRGVRTEGQCCPMHAITRIARKLLGLLLY